ncbi:MAG: MFS transporter [Chloroflexia bacterium]|jgi:EmrB/QacA subfamily drug resistance transporter|nr:MFS transporter [Chloroflexia bacterium]
MSPNASAAPQITHLSHMTGKQLYIAMAGIMLGLLLSALDQTIVGTAMPRIVTDLGGLESYAWVTTSYMLASTASVPIFGKLSDIYGRKWFYIGGLVMFMIASALCGLSQSMLQLILFRGLQGVAGGIIMANAFTIIGDLFPPKERGKWQGLLGAMFGIASVVGPILGGWLADGPGWRWVFYINLPVGVIAIAVLLIGLPYIRPHGVASIDWWGAALIVIGIVPLLLAFTWAGTEYAWSSPLIIGLLALAFGGILGFIFTETRAKDPIIPLGLFRDRIFSISIMSSSILGAAMFGAILYIPLFMQGVRGTSAAESGLVLMPMMLSMVTASIVGGQLISRTGRYKWAIVSGLFLMLTGMFLLSRMGLGTTNISAIRNMIVLGLGVGLVMPTITLAVQNAFPPRQLGVVTSSLQFFRSIGGTIGIALMGTYLTTQISSNITRDVPAETLAQTPQEALDEITPQALANPEARLELEAAFDAIPNGDQVFANLLEAMRGTLASAIQDVFLIATGVAVFAVIIGMFLPERTLRTRNDDEPEPSDAPATDAAPTARPITGVPSASND